MASTFAIKDGFSYTLAAFGILLMLGILFRFLPDDKNSKLRPVGWGFLYGSISFMLISIVIAIGLTNALSNH